MANNENTAAFPTGLNTSQFGNGILHFLTGDRYDWDVVSHEFGHYAASRHGISNSLGGPHSATQNLRWERALLTRQQADRLAWSEGWATFFGTSSQLEQNVAALGIQRAGDSIYDDNQDERNGGDGITRGGFLRCRGR